MSRSDPPDPSRPAGRGRLLVSGASGFLGAALLPELRRDGWQVHRLVRRAARAPDEVEWHPEREPPPAVRAAAWDAVVHLAGENLAGGRWTAARKRAIRDSRVFGTRHLVQALLTGPARPGVILSGSAVGYYGDTGEREVTEADPAGRGFLADVCRAWEEELAPARTAGVRTVTMRTGLVLAPDGGALARLRPVFRLGAGGRLGSGRQWMSWITRDDWGALCRRALLDTSWAGPINAVAPEPVRNVEFTRALAAACRRPALVPVPAALLRLVAGEMADEALLASNRVRPVRALAGGFEFRWPELGPALEHLLAAPRRE